MFSQEEARVSLLPTLRTTLGVTGQRPVVGHLDCHESLDFFGALHLVSGQLTTCLVARPTKSKRPRDAKYHYWHEALARPLRASARADPAARPRRVVIVV